ncbi:hypothetical protein V8C37DRAFT_419038 [Trichoderma ceciliae]
MDGVHSIRLAYILRHKDGFYKQLQDKYGIGPDGVDFGQRDMSGYAPVLDCVPWPVLYGVASLANLAHIITVKGELANDVMAIYDIVNDPESAPMAMFGMLLVFAFLHRTSESFGEMGKLRLKMNE